MSKSELSPFPWKLAARVGVGLLCVLVTCLTPAFGQGFTLTMTPFPPPAAIDPGGTSNSTITLTPEGNFSGTIDLSCQVTLAATGQVVDTLVCDVTPSSAAPPATASATITTSNTNSPAPGLYTVTVTGTAGATTESGQQNLTVLAVTPNFTITVTQQVEPTSVHAGFGGQGIVSVNPLNGYISPSGTNEGVWLSCATITPLVVFPPTCSFNPNPVQVSGSEATPSTISISTIGPVPRAAFVPVGSRYALWLPVPMLGLAGVGVLSRKRSRRVCGLLGFLVLGGALLLLPACGPSNIASGGTTTINPTNQITPKNSYSFTITGIDTNGIVSGNQGSGAPTVTLTVN